MVHVKLSAVEELLVRKIVAERHEALQAVRQKEQRDLAVVFAAHNVPEGFQVDIVEDGDGLALVYQDGPVLVEGDVSQPSS